MNILWKGGILFSMIPCKDCISFALCNACEDKITCSILYEYFIKGGISVVNDNDNDAQFERLEEISTFFNRKIASWYLGSSGTLYYKPNITVHWVNFPRKLRDWEVDLSK